MNVSAIVHWIVSNPSLDVNLLLGSGALSLILERLLTKYQVESKKIAFTLLHVVGVLTAVASAVLGHVSAGDATGVYGFVVIAASFWHRFVISGIFTKTVDPALNDIAAGNPAGAVSTVTANLSAVPGTSNSAVTGDAKPFTLDPATAAPAGK